MAQRKIPGNRWRRRTAAFGIALAACYLFRGPSPAAADETSYRLQIAMSDILGDATAVTGILAKNNQIGLVGAAVAVFGAPIIHGLHDQGSAAGKSILMRLTVLAIPIWIIPCKSEDARCSKIAGIATISALLVAQIVDSVFITPGAARDANAVSTMFVTLHF